MSAHPQMLAAVLFGTALFAGLPAAAQGPVQQGGTAITAPSPVRPDFTRPGGLPGAARSIGAPERFCDPAQDKKKCKGATSN